MKPPITDIQGVVDAQLCCGCGACAALAADRYEMRDVDALGRRPVPLTSHGRAPDEPSRAAREAFEACPGRRLVHDFDRAAPELDRDLMPAWGPVREVWEGHASDPEIRWAGSSGGAATALALYCIERGGMHAVLHAAARSDRPHLNETVLSRTRDALLSRTGSRYAPASPCDGLDRIESAPGPCAFIGKPCDVAGARSAASVRPALEEKLGLTIAFFCAGVPSTRGTLDLLRHAGVGDPSRVTSLRYRGNGWPGRWTATWTDDDGRQRESSLSYEESWGFLEKYRQWRCRICPDHTGEFADVSVGDHWYRHIDAGEAGSSLIVVRTRRGAEAVRAAADAGYLQLLRRDSSLLPRSQPNLLRTRGRLWGQLVALRLIGAARPRYDGFQTFRWWLRLGSREKVRSVLGTMRRVRRLRRSAAPELASASTETTSVGTCA